MKRKSASPGFTITELLVATGLMSAFFLIGASVIHQLFAFQKDVSQRLMDNFSVVSFHKALAADLEGSYWHRFNSFICPSSEALMDTTSSNTMTLGSSGGFVEFVTSDYSSTVGNVPNTDKIAVATMRNLDVGNYVLLSHAASPSSLGLFRVKTVDRDLGQITLDTSTLNVAGTDCSFASSAKAITDFFGTSNSNVILTRIKVVQYAIQNGELTRAVLPGGGEEKIQGGMRSMRITSNWTGSSDDASTLKQYGQMKFDVVMDSDRSTLMGSKNTVRETQTINAQYALNSFQYVNRSFSSGSAPITAVFPTCSVGYNFRPGALQIDSSASDYSDTIALSITGHVSTDKVKGATIDITFSPGPGAAIYCFKHDPDQGIYPTTGTITEKGIQGSISLAQPSGFDVYTCAVKGNIEVSSSMTYFAADISQVKTISCSSDSIQAPLRYRFMGARPSCDAAWARWDMGGEIYSQLGNGNTVSIGKFGVDTNASCQWEGDPNAFDSGKANDCDWGNHLGKDLKRIYLRPYKQQVYRNDNTTPIFDSRGAYIDCD